MTKLSTATLWVVAGDVLTALLLSIIGYLSHYYGKEPFSLRWMSTFLPFCLAWLIAALPMGLFSAPIASSWRKVSYRALAAGMLSGPFAAMLRGFWLDAAVVPVFMLVLTAFGGLFMLIWRLGWAWIAARNHLYG